MLWVINLKFLVTTNTDSVKQCIKINTTHLNTLTWRIKYIIQREIDTYRAGGGGGVIAQALYIYTYIVYRFANRSIVQLNLLITYIGMCFLYKLFITNDNSNFHWGFLNL